MGQARVLLFRARERLCALPIASAIETMRPLSVEPFPDMPSFVLGLSVIRGATVPVVDAGALLEGDGESQARRFILLRAGTRRVALAVDDVLDVRPLGEDVLSGVPPLLGASRADVIDAVGTLDRELLLVLRGTRLVPDSVWRAIEKSPGSR